MSRRGAVGAALVTLGLLIGGGDAPLAQSLPARVGSPALAFVPARVLAVGPASAPAPADSSRKMGLVEELRQRDLEFFEPELFEFPRELRDSTLAAFDSLGFEAYRDKVDASTRRFDVSFGLAEKLLDYNRVEGLVGGPSATVRPLGSRGPQLKLQGAFATGPGEFRHYEALRLPIRTRNGSAALELGYADRVIPYGSNRPGWNAIRALVGGSDERDYLRRRGGWAGAAIRRDKIGTLRLNYQAARENSVAGTTDFSLFGDLEKANPSVVEGIDRAVIAQVVLGSITDGSLELNVSHRIGGGVLGGDFGYVRTDAMLRHRRYLLTRHEVQLELRGVLGGGALPRQRLADLGGLSTIRGFEHRARVGDASFAARLEYLFPYDLLGRSGIPGLRDLRLQFVPWADAGRVWEAVGEPPEGGVREVVTRSVGLVGSEAWITSAGLGIQTYLGPFDEAAYLRLDLAVPMGPDRTEDLLVYLRLAARNF